MTIKLHLVAGYRATPHLPGLWKYCLPRSQSMVPVRLGTSVLQCFRCPSHCVKVYTHLFFCSLPSLKGSELLLGNREKGENAFSQRQKELDNYRQKCIFSKLGKMNNHNKIWERKSNGRPVSLSGVVFLVGCCSLGCRKEVGKDRWLKKYWENCLSIPHRNGEILFAEQRESSNKSALPTGCKQ